MSRKPNIHGGGAQTNLNGLKFERETNLLNEIGKNAKYSVDGNNIKHNGGIVAEHYEKNHLYKILLKRHNIDYKKILSKKLLPDEAFLVGQNLYIIEKKFQAVHGSVDEKLQTCDFKKKQYQKLLRPANINVEYYYLLNDWFEHPRYKDVLDYIESVGCKYFIGTLPLSEINL